MAWKRATALLLGSLALCGAQNVTLLNLLSRPDIHAPTMYLNIHNAALTAPGYIFITPSSPGSTNFQIGPYIYNNLGHLVYSGYALMKPNLAAFDAQVCDYLGSNHFCFTQFTGPIGGGPGGLGSFSEILDESYTLVRSVAPNGTYAGQSLTQDLHEFHVVGLKGQSALLTSYVSYAHSVTYAACPGSPSTAYTKNGLFSEVTTDGSNTELFQWSAIDHVDPHDTYVCPGDTNAGTGKTASDGFDFFHINSVDKDSNGDYLVSSRHTSTLYKVAGLHNPEGLAPGTVIWRLGGKQTSFPTMDSVVPGTPNLNFSWQHHARWRPSISGVSLWDNSNNNVNPPSALASSGMSIRITNTTATLIDQYVSPGRQLDSSQGSHQFLANGNHFLGLGSYPYIYEQTSAGDTVWYADFGVLPLQSYRAYKFLWTGTPLISEIALFAYAQNCSAPAAFYASWNGATEAVKWQYFTSSTKTGTFVLSATAVNNGTFETFTTGIFNLYAYAVSYDANGNRLGQTKTVKTFVPNAKLAASCNEISCPPGTDYATAAQATCGAPAAPKTSSTPVKVASTISVKTTSTKSIAKAKKTNTATTMSSSHTKPPRTRTRSSVSQPSKSRPPRTHRPTTSTTSSSSTSSAPVKTIPQSTPTTSSTSVPVKTVSHSKSRPPRTHRPTSSRPVKSVPQSTPTTSNSSSSSAPVKTVPQSTPTTTSSSTTSAPVKTVSRSKSRPPRTHRPTTTRLPKTTTISSAPVKTIPPGTSTGTPTTSNSSSTTSPTSTPTPTNPFSTKR